jgi:hypothetical protein
VTRVLSTAAAALIAVAATPVAQAAPLAKHGVVTRGIGAIQRQIAGHTRGYAYASYLDRRTGRVQLLTDAPRAVTAPLTTRFAGRLVLRSGAPHDDIARPADVAPFWGGASIRSGDYVCSAGFTVRDRTGKRFLATAGHCFERGAHVRTRDRPIRVGSVVRRAPIPPFDMELIGGQTYGAAISTGNHGASSRRWITGAADPIAGATGYCRSGQTTGEQCGQTILSVDAQVCTETGCKSPVVVYTGGTAGASALGDSGAPLYLPAADGRTAQVAGLHIATAGSISFAEKWSRIATRFRVEIAVGRSRKPAPVRQGALGFPLTSS